MSAQTLFAVESAFVTDAVSRALIERARTRIPPGADPRAQWIKSSGLEVIRAESSRWAIFEPANSRPEVWTFTGALDANPRAALRGQCRYVPQDVVRWRDPEHRAEMTRRARELAAAVRRAGGE